MKYHKNFCINNDKNKILTNKNIKRNEDEKLMLETCSLKIHDSQHSSFISRTNIKFQELLKLTMSAFSTNLLCFNQG